MKRVLIVGAGLTGSIIARELAEAGVPSLVIDKDNFIGGLCHSRRDEESGVDVHVFGPHIFNTSNERVWEYVQKFDRFAPWINRVKASNAKGVFSFPINLHTINQLFGVRLTPEQAVKFIDEQRDKSIVNPKNAEEKLLSMVGAQIYETFFKGYTIKQWGVSPTELSPDILKRIPVRFNYDDNYYFSRYQGFPMSGYTQWITNILTHPLVEVKLSTSYEKVMKEEFEHVFYAGPLDEYFDYVEGDLSYRTVTFETVRGKFEQQGCGCMNYSDLSVPYTRAHEHNYFSPWEHHEKSVLIQEFSHESTRESAKIYPKRMEHDMKVLAAYMSHVEKEEGVSFIGRLGCYRYLDMQQCVLMALDYAETWLKWHSGELLNLPKMPNEV
ncbi:MAG: UDP-galactopyranose mutase [Akkermansia sp.]|nr:UDP-galactopyranose mutase [Akkermansia sp.]